MCDQEGIADEGPALELVARQATGWLRDAISLLDQLVGAGPSVTLVLAQDLLGASASQSVQQLVNALAASDLTVALDVINGAIDARADPPRMSRQVVIISATSCWCAWAMPPWWRTHAQGARRHGPPGQRLPVPALLRRHARLHRRHQRHQGRLAAPAALELAVVECIARLPTAEPAEPVPAAAARSRALPRRPPPRLPRSSRAGPRPRPPRRPRWRASRPAGSSRPRPRPPRRPPAKRPAAKPAAWPSSRPNGAGSISLINEQDKLTAAIIASCHVVAQEGTYLRVSTNKFVYQQLQADNETRGKVDAMVARLFGPRLVVRYKWPQRTSARRTRTSPDGLVATALDLGGEIVED